LRYLGFTPDDLSTAPWAVVVYVARQLGVSPEAIHAYGQRIKTRTAHLQQVQAYLDFRTATPLALYGLHTWLVEHALEHAKPTLLLSARYGSRHLGLRGPQPQPGEMARATRVESPSELVQAIEAFRTTMARACTFTQRVSGKRRRGRGHAMAG
jgi:hypothetical protein